MASARTQVIDAVEQQGLRVTLGDIASSTGLALAEAKQELLSLAQQAEGHLQVSDQGEIAYVFQPEFRQILSRKQRQSRWANIRRRIWQIFLYGVRASFGVLLLLSILLIFAALIALQFANKDDNNDRVGPSFRFFYIPDLWLFWNPYSYGRYSDRPRRRARSQTRADREEGMNFLESVYSFLFGDGNPNEDLDKRRDQLIGTTIRNNGGVVTGEQILPYLDLAPDSEQLGYEDYMLPILAQFDGRPEVSDQGGIVYRFPELQVAAAKRRARKIPKFLQEKPWVFSQAPSGQRALAAGLGVLNFFLAFLLFILRGDVAAGAMEGSGLAAALLGFVNPLVGILLAYGLMFVTVPLVRWAVLKGRNKKVESRNEFRSQWADRVTEPTTSLAQKLEFADSLSREEIVREEDTIYSTDKDLIEQRDYDLDRPEFQQLIDREEGADDAADADQKTEENLKLLDPETLSDDQVGTPVDLPESEAAEISRSQQGA